LVSTKYILLWVLLTFAVVKCFCYLPPMPPCLSHPWPLSLEFVSPAIHFRRPLSSHPSPLPTVPPDTFSPRPVLCTAGRTYISTFDEFFLSFKNPVYVEWRPVLFLLTSFPPHFHPWRPLLLIAFFCRSNLFLRRPCIFSTYVCFLFLASLITALSSSPFITPESEGSGFDLSSFLFWSRVWFPRPSPNLTSVKVFFAPLPIAVLQASRPFLSP